AGPGAGNGGQPYVAPGYVAPGAAYYGPPPAYGPGYGPPPGYAPGYAIPAPAYAPAYAAPVPAYRAPPVAVYGAAPPVVTRPYAYSYRAEYGRGPAGPVPYTSGNNCVFSYGRLFCD